MTEISKTAFHYIHDQNDNKFVLKVKNNNVLNEAKGPETKFANVLEAKLRVEGGPNIHTCGQSPDLPGYYNMGQKPGQSVNFKA